MKSSWLILFLLTVVFCSCDLQKAVNIELPAYDSRLVVECYLEPGKPFTLLITQSSAYFDVFPTDNGQFLENLLVDNAEVTIHFKDTIYELKNELTFNGFTNKIFNYKTYQEVPLDYDHDFDLNIITPEGKTITATTRLIPPIPIDSVAVEFKEADTLARVLTYFTDIPHEANFFRRMLHKNSLDSLPEQDFTTDDRIVEDVVVFGSQYTFEEGEKVINTLFHIDQAYYDFLESLSIAVNSNGNPFGQPSPILSNLEGTADAIGIFTGLSYDRKTTFVHR